MIDVEIVRLPHGEGLPEPSAATAGAAGYDVASADDIELAPGARALVRTGFAIAIPVGFECQIRPRSGLALKHGVTLPNSPATIDSDYRGELKVALVNLRCQLTDGPDAKANRAALDANLRRHFYFIDRAAAAVSVL